MLLEYKYMYIHIYICMYVYIDLQYITDAMGICGQDLEEKLRSHRHSLETSLDRKLAELKDEGGYTDMYT